MTYVIILQYTVTVIITRGLNGAIPQIVPCLRFYGYPFAQHRHFRVFDGRISHLHCLFRKNPLIIEVQLILRHIPSGCQISADKAEQKNNPHRKRRIKHQTPQRPPFIKSVNKPRREVNRHIGQSIPKNSVQKETDGKRPAQRKEMPYSPFRNTNMFR